MPSPEVRMTDATARFALLRLISIQLNAVGFTHVQDKSLLEDIEGLLDGLIEGLVRLAYELAQHTRRSRPNIRDMLGACADQGIELGHLLSMLSQTLPYTSVPDESRLNVLSEDLNFELPIAPATTPHDPTLGFLSSDSESDNEQEKTNAISPSNVRKKLNPELIGSLPHLPALPAKHTWRETYVKPAPVTVIPPSHVSQSIPVATTSGPSSIPQAAPRVYPFEASPEDPNIPSCLHSLNRRILDTRLVERSLQNLMERTSATTSAPSPRRLSTSGASLGETLVSKHAAKIQIPIINFEKDWYGSKNERTKRMRTDSSSRA
ncbi:hypothetical protein CROQUDRAFT_714720 [Cronartium quercuum f. sp. fusiforme G11]|uniref:Transcription factor TFIID subunit 8 C-terminal domain-containing protein n=1 Tax=Cronartium quercuum f. sp. fusiforme G11 TaxID=708437 RepID=A0A9P6TDA3_9BASI|nr:hypothetical protein CROQUDRAFT_714720 [Cronartium quercuum f. sp. fusiforme G11]